jgi:hypothetical protein
MPEAGPQIIEVGDRGHGHIGLFLAGGRKLAAVLPPGPHRLADEWTVLDCEGRAVERNTREEALCQARVWAQRWLSRHRGAWTAVP